VVTAAMPVLRSTRTTKNGSYVRRPRCCRSESGGASSGTCAMLVARATGEITGPGVQELVRARSTPHGGRPVGAPGELAAAERGVDPFAGRASRALADVARLEEAGQERATCTLSASTIHRWLRRAGEQAKRGSKGNGAGWRTRDSLDRRLVGTLARWPEAGSAVGSGHGDWVVWTTKVSEGEQKAAIGRAIPEAKEAGVLGDLDGLVSDGAAGLLSFLREFLVGSSPAVCLACLA